MDFTSNRYTKTRKADIILNQILVHKISDENLISKVMSFNMANFLPEDKAYLVNSDSFIEYTKGRYMMDIATLTQLLSLVTWQPTDKVLLLGLGLGHLGAILSTYVNELQAFEEDPEILQRAHDNLHKYNISNVEFLTKQQLQNYGKKMFNYIVINGAFAELPTKITNLLVNGGSIIGIERENQLSKIVKIQLVDNTLLKTYYKSVPMPFLKGFEPKEKFIF